MEVVDGMNKEANRMANRLNQQDRVVSAAVDLLNGRDRHTLSAKENILLLGLEEIGRLKSINGFIKKVDS